MSTQGGSGGKNYGGAGSYGSPYGGGTPYWQQPGYGTLPNYMDPNALNSAFGGSYYGMGGNFQRPSGVPAQSAGFGPPPNPFAAPTNSSPTSSPSTPPNPFATNSTQGFGPPPPPTWQVPNNNPIVTSSNGQATFGAPAAPYTLYGPTAALFGVPNGYTYTGQ